MTSQNRITLAVIAAILILAALFLLYPRKAAAPAASTSMTASSTQTIQVGTSTATSTSGGYTVTPIYSTAGGPQAPDYKAPLAFSDPSVPADQRAQIQASFSAAQSSIAKNGLDLNAWIALGDARKQAGDYAGAATDFQYVSAVSPTNLISFNNLADLYANYLKDYPKAAAAYQAAIKNDPHNTGLYADLFTLYVNQYPQGSSNPSLILQQGLKANPDASDLRSLLARYEENK